jgi:hypothetical protein
LRARPEAEQVMVHELLDRAKSRSKRRSRSD